MKIDWWNRLKLLKQMKEWKLNLLKKYLGQKKPRNHNWQLLLVRQEKIGGIGNLTIRQIYTIYYISYLRISAFLVSIFLYINRMQDFLARQIFLVFKGFLGKQARSQGGRGEDSPPARLKKVKFALNIKHALFYAML